MAALNFPSAGLVAGVTTHTENGSTWLWDGTSWVSQGDTTVVVSTGKAIAMAMIFGV